MYIHRRGNTASTYNHTDAASLCIYYIEAGRTLVPSSAKLLHLWNFELQERAIVQGQGSCHVPPPLETSYQKRVQKRVLSFRSTTFHQLFLY